MNDTNEIIDIISLMALENCNVLINGQSANYDLRGDNPYISSDNENLTVYIKGAKITRRDMFELRIEDTDGEEYLVEFFCYHRIKYPEA